MRLLGRERRGRVHQSERLPVFLHRLGELGVLLFLLGFNLALGVVAVVREACIAISATGHVRNVEQLVTDLLKVERLASQVRQQPIRV